MGGAIVRQIDELGRVVIPAEIRSTFGIVDGTALEVFLDGENIALKVYRPGCAFCGHIEDTRDLEGRLICRSCAHRAVDAFGIESEATVLPATMPPRGAQDRVVEYLRLGGWEVEERGPYGKAVDLVAWTHTRTWYIQVRASDGDERKWPSGHELGWLKGVARRQGTTPVVAFVGASCSGWSAEFWSAYTRRRLEA